MHTISTRLLADRLDTTETQVYLWIERGLLTAHTNRHFTTVIDDSKLATLTAAWNGDNAMDAEEAEQQAYTYDGLTHQAQIRSRKMKAHLLSRRGWNVGAIAQRIGRSKSTVYSYLQSPDPATQIEC